jgi:hypothetical protein
VKAAGGVCIKLSPTFFKGIPDRLVLLPMGRAFFVELKAPGKKPTAIQKYVHEALAHIGFPVHVIDTAWKVKLFMVKNSKTVL